MLEVTQLLFGQTGVRIQAARHRRPVSAAVLHTPSPCVPPGPEGADTAGGPRAGLAGTGLPPALIRAHTPAMTQGYDVHRVVCFGNFKYF